jgi:hypothetical protein
MLWVEKCQVWKNGSWQNASVLTFLGFMWSTRRDKKCIQKKLVYIKKAWYPTVTWLKISDKIPGYGTRSRCVGSMTQFVTTLVSVHWHRSWAVINGCGVWQLIDCFDARSSGPVRSNISLSTQGQQKQNTYFSIISCPSPVLPFHSQYGYWLLSLAVTYITRAVCLIPRRSVRYGIITKNAVTHRALEHT